MRHTRPGDRPAVRIEAESEWAWCGERRLELTPKAFAVLRHLVEHPERLITKDELFTAVWGDTVVSEAALTSCIRDLRKALTDSSRAPRYIETVHRRGFRFIGPIGPPRTSFTAHGSRAHGHGPKEVQRPASSPQPTPALVGREAELARLHALFDTAVSGRRQLVFVTGEAGIGKTALVEAFLAQLDVGEGLRIGHGQCVEQYGAGEAYLPVLEALGRMGREARAEELVRILIQYAPTWLAQLPALLADRDLEAVQRRAQGTTRDRMLRELIEAFDALSLEAPLVLILEDLHWSDSATIDLLAMLARRRDAARLLILATYRPADVAVSTHPLKPVKQELQLHGDCEELALEFLSEAAVGEYLDRRFPRASFSPDFVRLLHENTSGNPLFLVNVIDHLIAQGRVREVDGQWELSVPVEGIASGVPHTLWQMVEKQIEQMTPHEQAMLAVASVAGAEFSAALATADGIDAHDGEQCCAALARRGQFLRTIGVVEWPDGTVAGRYGFIHALYQNVLYARVSVGHRVGLHLRIGARLERAHGRRAGEIAGELAMHFEHGRDFERAVEYHGQAADTALRQHGYLEAANHSTRAVELLETLPESPERSQQELTFRVMLGAALTATKGHAAPEVARTYGRARELCARMGDTPELFPVLLGLGRFYLVRGALPTARDVATQMFTLAEATQDAALLLAAHNALGIVSFYAGEFDAALAHQERGLELYDPNEHSPNRSSTFRVGQDPGVSCTAHSALTLWVLGFPARAAARIQEAMTLARSLAHPYTLAYASHFAAGFYQCCRECQAVQELVDAALAQAMEHGFGHILSEGAIQRGWVLCEQGQADEGLPQMRQGVAALRETGAELRVPAYLALMAEVHEKIGRPAQGLSVVSEALAAAEQSGQCYWEAELYRLRGALTLQSQTGSKWVTGKSGARHGKGERADLQSAAPSASAETVAESCFLEAIDVARRQGAKSLELRAAMSLSRLWQGQGKTGEAHALLSGTYNWFTEGFDTADLREARSLLECQSVTAG